MSSTSGIEPVGPYRKFMQDYVEPWLTGARLTIIAAISLMVLFGLGISVFNTRSSIMCEYGDVIETTFGSKIGDCGGLTSRKIVDIDDLEETTFGPETVDVDDLKETTFGPEIVDDDEELLLFDFNMSFPDVPCKFASVNVRDRYGKSMLNAVTFRKYSIDSQTEEVVEELGKGSLVLNARNFDTILGEQQLLDNPIREADLCKLHPLMVVMFYASWCRFSNRLKPTWEEAAKIIGRRYGTEAGEGILVGEVDSVAETDLCRRYDIDAYPSIRIFRNGSDVIGKNVHGYNEHESYSGKRDTDSLVKMMEDLVALQSERMLERPSGTKRGCRIEGSIRTTAKMGWSVGGSVRPHKVTRDRSARNETIYLGPETMRAGRKFLDH